MLRKIPPGPLAGKRLDGEQVIAEIVKNARELIVVKASIFNGYPLIHVRLAFRTPEGKLRYTREGITVRPREQAQALAKAILEADRLSDDAEAPAPPVAPVAPVAANGTTTELAAWQARFPNVPTWKLNQMREEQGLARFPEP